MSDFTRLTRSDWLRLADRFYVRLDRTLASLNGPDWERITPYLGFRARDVLAHMASTIPVNFREVLGRALAGNPAAPPEFDTFGRNTREVARRQATPVSALLSEFRREHEAIRDTYRGMTDADWEKPAWFFIGRVRVRTLFLVEFADNVFHERDLLIANRRWTDGLDPEHAAPLVDWFLREFRPAMFRPDRVPGLRATMRYRLGGPAGGEWTLTVADGACRVEAGAPARADVTLEADAEELVAAGQARAAPWIGQLALAMSWMPRGRREDVVARITGMASLGRALALRRIRVSGNRAIATRLNRAFWHFWERTEMTAENIKKG